MKAVVKIIILVMVVAMVSTACVIPVAPRLVRGSGRIVEEERNVSGFDKILIMGAGNVVLTQGNTESLVIETDDNLLEYIVTEVKGNTLEIGFKEGTVFSSRTGSRVLEPSQSIQFFIQVVDLESLTLSGAARVEVEKLKTPHLDLALSGAGDIDLEDLDAESLKVVVSGAGDIGVSGVVESQEIRLSGLGRYQAFNLESQDADVTISGAGGAEVWAENTLKVTISGAGDVRYYGNPQVDPEISGLGRIQDMGDK